MRKTILSFTLVFVSIITAFSQSPCSNNSCKKGIDVSKFQGDIQWTKVKSSGISFCISKATQGTKITDPKFKANWEGSEILESRSAYHFYVTTRKGKKQAKYFMKSVGEKKWKEKLAPVIDIERIDGDVTTEEWHKQLRICLKFVERKWNVKPIIYSSENFYKTYLAESFKEYPVWIARYRQKGPEMQSWMIWQYTDSGKVNGIKGNVDLNYMP